MSSNKIHSVFADTSLTSRQDCMRSRNEGIRHHRKGRDVVVSTKRQFAGSASRARARRRATRATRPSRDGQGHEVLAPRALISRTRYVIAQTAYAYCLYERRCVRTCIRPFSRVRPRNQRLHNHYLIDILRKNQFCIR